MRYDELRVGDVLMSADGHNVRIVVQCVAKCKILGELHKYFKLLDIVDYERKHLANWWSDDAEIPGWTFVCGFDERNST